MDNPIIMPRIKTFTLKDNHITILEAIRGNVQLLIKDVDGKFIPKIVLHDYRGESLFITLPKEWIGEEILMRYDWFVPQEKITGGSNNE